MKITNNIELIEAFESLNKVNFMTHKAAKTIKQIAKYLNLELKTVVEALGWTFEIESKYFGSGK